MQCFNDRDHMNNSIYMILISLMLHEHFTIAWTTCNRNYTIYVCDVFPCMYESVLFQAASTPATVMYFFNGLNLWNPNRKDTIALFSFQKSTHAHFQTIWKSATLII